MAHAAPPTWSPPANLVTPLNQVWQHQEQTYFGGNLYGFRNYGWSTSTYDHSLWLTDGFRHTWGLDDFYDWAPSGVGGFLMRAGTARSITGFDAWMFRDWWRHLKNRYGY